MPFLVPCFSCFGDSDPDPVRDGVRYALQTEVGTLFSLLWNFSLGGVVNLLLLCQNAKALDEEMTELKEMRDDLERRVRNEEARQPQMECAHRVEGWLRRVEQLEAQVAEFHASFESRTAILQGLCLGYSAADKLKRVRDLKRQVNDFNEVVVPVVPSSAETLIKELNELREMREEVVREVELKEAHSQMKRTPQVKGWLESVDDALDSAVTGSPDTPSVGQLNRVRELKSRKASLGEVVRQAPPEAVEAVPRSSASSSIVGGEETLAAIRDCLRDDGIGIIGIYGMGGIGKTTLLREVNNQLLEPGSLDFDVVIWVTVSQTVIVSKIQKDIGDRLGLSLRDDQQARILHNFLSKKKFLLFLDDVWERLVLEDIGIPYPDAQNKCKVVFTTRSEEVCIDMDAHRIKVRFLDDKQSWELFRTKARADAILDDPSIRPLAEKVVAACGGLPLALITVGRAMANKKHSSEWKDAVEALKSNADELRGMEKDVLYALKFSYDYLRNDTMRSCLLYCALFPEDFKIDRAELVEYWVGEGFLDGRDGDLDIDRSRDRGDVVISSLQAACLLESGRRDEAKSVKLHDAVRDMVLWLTSGKYEKSNRFLVQAGKQLFKVSGVERWRDVTRISLMNNWIRELPEMPDCPSLLALLTNRNPLLSRIPCGFFNTTSALRILDLSYTSIKTVPKSISSLVELQYLNLMGTLVETLPKEIGSLVKLKQLCLKATWFLSKVPYDALSPLARLQSLNFYNEYPGYRCDWEWSGSSSDGGGVELQERQLSIKDLEGMEGLQELGLNIVTLHSLEHLLDSSRLLYKVVRFLSLVDLEGLTTKLLLLAFGKIAGLRELSIKSCSNLEEMIISQDQLLNLESLILSDFPRAKIVFRNKEGLAAASTWRGKKQLLPLHNLRCLEIRKCHGLRDLSWIRRLTHLERIELFDCRGIEELIMTGEEGWTTNGDDRVEAEAGLDDIPDSSLANLEEIRLLHLPRLRSICQRPLLLPALHHLQVSDCKELKRLPLGPRSAKNIVTIKGAQEWWDRLEWDDQITKSIFLPHFRVVNGRGFNNLKEFLISNRRNQIEYRLESLKKNIV